MEFFSNLFNNQYFTIILFGVIAVLVGIFIVVALLNNRNKGANRNVELNNYTNNAAFGDVSPPPTAVEFSATQTPQAEISVADSTPIYGSNDFEEINDLAPSPTVLETTPAEPEVTEQTVEANEFDSINKEINEPVLDNMNSEFKFDNIFEPVPPLNEPEIENVEENIEVTPTFEPAPETPVTEEETSFNPEFKFDNIFEPIVPVAEPEIPPFESSPMPEEPEVTPVEESIESTPVFEPVIEPTISPIESDLIISSPEPIIEPDSFKTTEVTEDIQPPQNQFSSVFVNNPAEADAEEEVVEEEIELPKIANENTEEAKPVIEVTPENVFPNFEPETYNINNKE